MFIAERLVGARFLAQLTDSTPTSSMGVQTVFPAYDVLFLASPNGVTIGVLKHTTLVGRASCPTHSPRGAML